MKHQDLVSIITPTYNCGKFIAATIESVLAQSRESWEMIIVDDCSTDDTQDIVLPYLKRDKRFVYLRNESNEGPAVTRTKALRAARGRWVAFLDSDDVWHPEKLERQIAFMESVGSDFSATAYEQIDEAGASRGVLCYPPVKTDYGKMLRLSDPVGNSTVMYDREALGDFEVPPIRKRNDFALWLKVLRKTRYCHGMQEVLGKYRVRENSVSSNKWSLIRYHWQLYRDIEALGVLRSAFYLLCWAFVKGTGVGLNRKRSK